MWERTVHDSETGDLIEFACGQTIMVSGKPKDIIRADNCELDAVPHIHTFRRRRGEVKKFILSADLDEAYDEAGRRVFADPYENERRYRGGRA